MELKPKRELCMGDLHGGFKALRQVLDRCNYNPKEDLLICLGDYVDGWSQSPECVDLLITIKEESQFKPIFIKGNHDVWCQKWLETTVEDPNWIHNGGNTTKEAYENFKMYHDFDWEKHVKFFKYLHLYYVDDKNRAFVHGGYTSEEGLGDESSLTNYYWDRDLWEKKAVSGHSNYKGTGIIPKLLRPYSEIFIGHTTTMAWQEDKPMHKCNVWNLDTGGGRNGKLTIMDINSKEYWQSDLVKELYPNESTE